MTIEVNPKLGNGVDPAVSRLQFAAKDPGLVAIDSEIAVGPAQNHGGTEGKNDALTVELGLNAYAFGGGRQGEVESIAKNCGIRIPHHVSCHWVDDLGFHKKSCGVGPRSA